MKFETKYSLNDTVFYRKGDIILRCKIKRIDFYTYLYINNNNEKSIQTSESYEIKYFSEDKWCFITNVYPENLFETQEDLANDVLKRMGFECGVKRKE